MLLSCEKNILKKQYEYVADNTKLWSFKKTYDASKQINLEYNKQNNKFERLFKL